MPTFTSLLIQCLALYTGTLLSLGTMSLFNQPTASFLYRLLASYTTLLLCALYGVLASLVLRPLGLHRCSQWATARAFKWTMRLTTGVHFQIIAGTEKHLAARPAVFVGNHQTALDVLLLGTIFPRWCSVTAKESLKRVPFLGWFMALSGTVFIDRKNKATALRAFEGAATEVREKGQSVFIFPEGTRSDAQEPTLLPFKKGAFHLAVQAGVPVVPVVAGCYKGVLNAKGWRFRRGIIPVLGTYARPLPARARVCPCSATYGARQTDAHARS